MEIDINKLYASTFGYVGIPYPLGNIRLPDFSGIKNVADAIAGKNLMGKPVYMPVAIDGQYLPNTFINITAQKHIVKTPVSGRTGTVKEIINAEDYQIQIRGFTINHEGGYPADEVEKLYDLFDKNISLPIANALCEIFGINMVVLENLKLPEQNFENVQAYEINLISDDDFDVIIN